MYYVYILKSEKNRRLYIGYTADLKRRLHQHNSDGPSTRFTSGGRPWHLVYYEAFLNKDDATKRELALKNHGNVFGLLKKRIIRSLEGAESGEMVSNTLVLTSKTGITPRKRS